MMKNVSYLDGFRGYAAFWVLAAHCAIWGGIRGVWIPDPKAAVDLFMIMSGFLMAYNTIQRAAIEPIEAPSTWLRFYVRRYFRLAPAYYLVLLAAVLLSVPFLGGYAELRALNPERWGHDVNHDTMAVEFGLANIAMHVTFLFGLLPEYASSTGLPDWSLGLEMQFYLIFPFLYLAMKRFGHMRVALPLIALTGATMLLFSRMEGPHGGLGLFPEPSFIFLKLHLFIIGIFLCDAFHGTEITAMQRYLLAFVALGLSFIQLRFYRLDAVILIAAVTIIIVLESDIRPMRQMSKVFGALLGNRLAGFMARASYSVYLTHGFFLAIVGAFLYRQPAYAAFSQSLRYGILLAAVMLCSYSTAFVMEHFVEEPSIRMGRRFAGKIPGTGE